MHCDQGTIAVQSINGMDAWNPWMLGRWDAGMLACWDAGLLGLLGPSSLDAWALSCLFAFSLCSPRRFFELRYRIRSRAGGKRWTCVDEATAAGSE